MKTKIAVLGAGSFGIALCRMFLNNTNFEVVLWSAVKEEILELLKFGENKKFLPEIKLNSDKIKLTTNLNDIVNADYVFFAVASAFVRDVAKMVKNYLKNDCIIVNIAKGLEKNSFKRLSEVILDELGEGVRFVALSGPSHAEEIAKFVPTTVVAASKNLKFAENLQQVFSSSIFRIYVSEDLIGVEIGGALKNTIALAVGICDGLNLGENSKAALMTRGIVEIGRLGVELGAKSQTFAGLSGIGDLIVTCISCHSRNWNAGFLIGKGFSVEAALNEVKMVVEGYYATEVAFNLSKKLDVSMPIIEELYEILYCGRNAKTVISKLMTRPVKREYEKLWFD